MIDKLFKWARACNAEYLNVQQFDQVQANKTVKTMLEVKILFIHAHDKFDHIQVYEIEEKVLVELFGNLLEGSMPFRLFRKFFPEIKVYAHVTATVETPVQSTEELDFL